MLSSFDYKWDLELEDELLEARESTLMDIWRATPSDVKMNIIRLLITFGPIYYRRFRNLFLKAVRGGMSARVAYRYVLSRYPTPAPASGRGKLTATQVRQYLRRQQRRLPSKWRQRRFRRQRY
jgi:hypothetical protein